MREGEGNAHSAQHMRRFQTAGGAGRTGASTDAELIHELRALRRYIYRHPPSNNQRTLALFLSMGHYDAHARRLRDRLARKWRVISRAMAEHLPQLNASGMAGGSSLWVSCPPDVDAWVLQRLVARRVALADPRSGGEAQEAGRFALRLTSSLAGQTGQMRAADHQFQQPLAVGVMERKGAAGVPFDVEGSGYGFRVVREITALQAELPSTCQMKRF